MSKQMEIDLNNCRINTGVFLTSDFLDYVKAKSYSTGIYSITNGECYNGIACSVCILREYACEDLTVTLPIIAQHFPHLQQRYPELFI